MDNLQKKIDEYNKQTRELVEGLKDILQIINKRAKESNQWCEDEYKDLENFLQELNNHHQIVKAFLEGYQMGDSEIKFQLSPLLYDISPIIIEDYAQYINYNYNLKYNNLITSVINIIY